MRTFWREKAYETGGMMRGLRVAFALVACVILIVSYAKPAWAAGSTPRDSRGGNIEQAAVTTQDVSSSRDGFAGNSTISESGDAIVVNGTDYAINSFSRSNKDTNRTYNDVYYGYRYPVESANCFSVVVAQGYMLVYIPSSVIDQFGIDINDASFQQTFLSMLDAVDRQASRGGTMFADLQDETIYFTDSSQVVVGDYTYSFNVEIEDGHYYTTVVQSGSEDGSSGGLYAESGELSVPAETVVNTRATGLAALQQFLSNLDWSPLWVSLRTTFVATAVIFFLGLIAAWLTIRVSDKAKGVLDTLFTIPMVLPPTVCGFLLLLFFGKSTAIGRWLIAHGIDIVFTWPAAVIACIVVGFPLMYRTIRGAFENIDSSMLDAARTLGWSESHIFRKLMIPLVWPSIAAGTVLAFARAMGEFGATLFFAGNYVGVTQTIPIAIYFDWMAGQTDVAIFWVVVVILISFLVILLINVYSSRTQRYMKVNARDRKVERFIAHYDEGQDGQDSQKDNSETAGEALS